MFGLVVVSQVSLQNSRGGFTNTATAEDSGSGNLRKELMEGSHMVEGHTWLRGTHG